MVEDIDTRLSENAGQIVVSWLVNPNTYADRALGTFLKLKL
jgi:hypothetical protein